MCISRTDLKLCARYLADAAVQYLKTANKSTRIEDRARLMRNLARKIEKRIEETKNNGNKEKEETDGAVRPVCLGGCQPAGQ